MYHFIQLIQQPIAYRSFQKYLASGFTTKKNKVMKNILQAAALIIIAASAIGAAALSHHKASEVNRPEWEKGFENAELTLGLSDSIFIFHLNKK
jgi:hypothetical protein